jgi:hypothetical protein
MAMLQTFGQLIDLQVADIKGRRQGARTIKARHADHAEARAGLAEHDRLGSGGPDPVRPQARTATFIGRLDAGPSTLQIALGLSHYMSTRTATFGGLTIYPRFGRRDEPIRLVIGD